MESASLQHFRDYLQTSISNLHSSLDQALDHEAFQYDVMYEQFLKIIETFKIHTLAQMKVQLFPSTLTPEHQQDRITLLQMKALLSTKIKKYILTY